MLEFRVAVRTPPPSHRHGDRRPCRTTPSPVTTSRLPQLPVPGPGPASTCRSGTANDDFASDGNGHLPAGRSTSDGTEVAVYCRFKSDGGWSDEDCSWPTRRRGPGRRPHRPPFRQRPDTRPGLLHRLPGRRPEPGGLGPRISPSAWATSPRSGPACRIWTTARSTSRPRWPSSTTGWWCRAPGAATASTGATDRRGTSSTPPAAWPAPNEHIDNVILSPVMDWPDPAYDGTLLQFDVYRHEDLSNDAPGSSTPGPSVRPTPTARAGTARGHRGRALGGPELRLLRRARLPAGRRRRHRPHEPGPGRGPDPTGRLRSWAGSGAGSATTATPRPTSTTSRSRSSPSRVGPDMTAREIDLAHDNFPERGSIDFEDLGSLHVRFDMAATSRCRPTCGTIPATPS